MSYQLKVTGITEAKRFLKELKETVKIAVKEIDGGGFSIDIPGIKTFTKSNISDFDDFVARLPAIFRESHKAAIKNMTESLRMALNDAMESPVWDWNGDNRDIIDTGALRDSLNLYADSDGDIHIMYGEDYAAIVHYGGYFHPYGNKTIKQYYPGRPWITAVLNGGGPVDQFDFESEYKRLLGIEFSSRLK